MTTETLKVEQDGTTLDLLLWRRFGEEVIGRVEATFAGNPGIAETGVFLPVGAEVDVDLPDANLPPVIRAVRLWG